MEAIPRHRRSLLGARHIRHQTEDGFVLVFVAISITVLCGLAGFSVDIGNWYLHIARTQAKADAASLAGAVFLPETPDKALAAARASLAQNNATPAQIAGANIRPASAGASDLVVSVPTEAHNSFLPLLGFANVTKFEVTSTARWQPGIGIGDYSNVLGNEPPDTARPGSDLWQDPAKTKNQGQFWLGASGGQAEKQSGDRYEASNCNDEASGCSGGKNNEFKAAPDGVQTQGYLYVVSAEKGQPGSAIQVQAFDPALAPTGNKCEDMSGLPATNPRYAGGLGPFCVGDNDKDEGDVGNLTTTYFQFLDYETKKPIPSCPTIPFAPWSKPLSSHLTDPKFIAQFHEWYPLCNLPYNSATGSKYYLRVSTEINKVGENFYSLRAGLVNSASGLATTKLDIIRPATQQSVSVFAKKDLSLWANMSGANSQFAIAKIPPSYAGQEVSLQLFDLGDAEEPGTLTVIAAATTKSGANPATDCAYIPPKSKKSKPLTNCTLGNVNEDTGYQGQAFSIIWRVPADYTCDPSGATPGLDCYMFLKIAYPPGSEVTDRTTWSSSGESQPLRLIPNPKPTPNAP